MLVFNHFPHHNLPLFDLEWILRTKSGIQLAAKPGISPKIHLRLGDPPFMKVFSYEYGI